MARAPTLGNQLWWDEVKRGKGQLREPIISHVEIPPGYQQLPEKPRGQETTDPVKPTPSKSRYSFAEKAATQAPMLPREEVKIDQFVNGVMPPAGKRPVPRDANGLEVIEAVKGYVPPGHIYPDVIKAPLPPKTITPPKPLPYPGLARSTSIKSQKPSDPVNGPLTLQDLAVLEEKADEQGGQVFTLQWRI